MCKRLKIILLFCLTSVSRYILGYIGGQLLFLSKILFCISLPLFFYSVKSSFPLLHTSISRVYTPTNQKNNFPQWLLPLILRSPCYKQWSICVAFLTICIRVSFLLTISQVFNHLRMVILLHVTTAGIQDHYLYM